MATFPPKKSRANADPTNGASVGANTPLPAEGPGLAASVKKKNAAIVLSPGVEKTNSAS